MLERLRSARVPVVLATSSRNASAVLAAAGLSNAFDLVVGGFIAGELGLPGKPDPALFLHYRDHLLTVKLQHEALTVSAAPGDAAAISLRVGTEQVLLEPGGTRRFPLRTESMPGDPPHAQ